ncbi:hypothetical protein BC962_3294 [Gillisia mitskevichiae]|uniref:Tissue inhibitor of metalloproteinase n=1 Tax=Gillisia mitskevichiae TaxID=270921 RepID=A0A495NY59_9FLAO|nr:hypothetical protein [Gillisia mitskevichiae]RKS42480.1 hypothetical protein BC962_3294 [Gillisia mitskevichiae]
MKKNYILTIFALMSLTLSFGQNANDDFIDIITSKTCECVELKKKTESDEKLTPKMQMGICLFQSAKEYKKELAEQYDFNLDNLEDDAERLGKLIGNRMAFICPNTLLKFSVELEDEKEDSMVFFASGEITDIKEDMFVVFNVKNQEGKIEKFFWLTFLSSEYDVQNSFEKLKGKNIKIKYFEQELFDPRIKEYRVFNSISSLELME